MDRSLICFNKDNRCVISDNDSFLLFDGNKLSEKDKFELVISKDIKVNILFLNITKELTISILLEEGATLNIKGLLKDEIKTLNIDAKLCKNAEIIAYFADFIEGDNKSKIAFDLLEEGAKATWHLASLSSQKDSKEFSVFINHIAAHTVGYSENFGVVKNNASLVFSGESLISKGAKSSITRQNAKIMVFDERSKAIAKPILRIDENEIEASHAASVGKISDEHLFYMMSRGLSEENARELITYGYLKPIVVGFEDEEIKEEILTLIERRM